MKIKGLRWWIIALIGVATVINYIDRSAINYMWPFIYKEFGVAEADSKNALALITTFFMIAYALGQTLTGKMMDAIGTRLGMVVSIIGWSISIALHATARSLASFNVFRFMLGLTEAGNWPGATKSNAEWFPARERGIAQGIFGAGASLGGVVAPPAIAALFLAFGWRSTFVLVAVLGLVWILPWMLVNRATPDKHPWLSEEERAHILDRRSTEQAAATAQPMGWRQLLGFRNTWSILLARFFADPIWWLFVTWLPTFLKEQFGFDLKQVAAFAWFPYLMAAIGGLLGGLYAARRIRGGVEAARARKEAIGIGSALMLAALATTAFCLPTLRANIPLALGLISATLFGFQFIINNIQTLPSDYFHGKNVGTVAGMGGTAAVAGTLLVTWSVPFITRSGYVTFFILGAVLVPLSWACIAFLSGRRASAAPVKKNVKPSPATV
ncbi:MFS transporter [Flaviaesturariibacter aridisoli]|uniref:MFS transporter n=1 Tax=Flaviaesturariibacter aridisoli TaxID=2545761 RepID=A0A4R4E2E8_9BACT|nr:MFS transporter [Flaviaesturariibacter aridisoli]TCZ72943.1 MFS transporter [Flaviaesturariibacter aridisoli]